MMALTSPKTILFLFTTLCGVVCVAGLSCKDMNGHDVDWYYVYKLPRLSHNANPLIKRGVAFNYLDNFQQTFQLSKTSMEEKTQSIAHTLQQIYNRPSKIAHVMYNDQPPNGTEKLDFGHTKGVIAYDSGDGFWLMHSIPWFPENNTYEWPEKAKVYGQTALCVSLKSSEMEAIAKQLLYTQPYVYSYKFTTDFLHIAPTFQDVVQRRFVTNPPWFKVQFRSRDGQRFTHYAKSNLFGKDLYFDLVAQDLESDLLAETWRRHTALSSNCSLPYHVNNVMAIQFLSTGQIKSTKDHSKWAITNNGPLQVVCIGDINRMGSQFKRAGGLLCSHLPGVWEQYNTSVAQVQPCPSSLQQRRGL